MSTIDIYEEKRGGKSALTADRIRDSLIAHTKDFKTSWINLGRALYPVWKDKLFYAWGYDKFEYYTEKELGIKKATAIKLLKSYFFLEQEEPAYLAREFSEDRGASQVPSVDAVNVLRMAKAKRELSRDDYQQIKEAVFDKGKDASLVRKDLTALIKERKQVDPDEERESRSVMAVRRLLYSLRSFEKDMDTLKLLPAEIVEEAKKLKAKLEEEVE